MGLWITIKTNVFDDLESVFVVESSWIILTICESLRTLLRFFLKLYFDYFVWSAYIDKHNESVGEFVVLSVLNWMGKRILQYFLLLKICVSNSSSELELNLIAIKFFWFNLGDYFGCNQCCIGWRSSPKKNWKTRHLRNQLWLWKRWIR